MDITRIYTHIPPHTTHILHSHTHITHTHAHAHTYHKHIPHGHTDMRYALYKYTIRTYTPLIYKADIFQAHTHTYHKRFIQHAHKHIYNTHI